MKIGPTLMVATCLLAGGCGKKDKPPPTEAKAKTQAPSANPGVPREPLPPVPVAEANTTKPAPPPPITSSLPLPEQARREMLASYFYNGVNPAKVAGEDLTGDGRQDIGRLDFDAEVRQRFLRHTHALGIGFSQTTVTRKMQSLFVNTNGVHQPALQQEFEAALKDQNLTAADWRRSVHNDLAIRHLNRVHGLTGGFMPARVSRHYYALDRELFDADLVVFAATNFVRQVPDTVPALNAFYQKNAQRYRQPDLLDIVHVPLRFSVLDPTVKTGGTELNREVEEIYKKNKNAYNMPAEEARARIRRELLVQRHPKTGARFNALLKELAAKPVNIARLREVVDAHLELNRLQINGVTAPGASGKLEHVIRTAGQLDPGQLSPQPAVSDDALHLVALVTRKPQPFKKLNKLTEQQYSSVQQDYRGESSLELALKNGRAFAPVLVERVNAGQSFESVCQAAKVWVVPLPRFTLGQADWGTNAPPLPLPVGVVQSTVLPMLDGGETSRLSGFVQVPGGGFVLRLKKRHGTANAPPTEVRKFVNEMRLRGMAAASLDSLYPVTVEPALAALPPGWMVAEWRNLRRALMLRARGKRILSVSGEITKAQQAVNQKETQLAALKRQRKNTDAVTKELNAALQQLYRLRQEKQFYAAEQDALARGPGAVEPVLPPPVDTERTANDALVNTLNTTNVTSTALLEVAASHPGTAAARRAQLVSAANLFHQEKVNLGAVQAQLNRLLNARPNDLIAPAALLGRAVCRDDLGQTVPAKLDYEALISRHPHHLAAVPARLALGVIAMEAGDTALAHARMQEVIQTDPVGYWARFAGLFKRRLPLLKPPR